MGRRRGEAAVVVWEKRTLTTHLTSPLVFALSFKVKKTGPGIEPVKAGVQRFRGSTGGPTGI